MHLIKECKSQIDEVFTIFRMLMFIFFFLNYINRSLDRVYFSQPVFSFYIAAASKYSTRLKRIGG